MISKWFRQKTDMLLIWLMSHMPVSWVAMLGESLGARRARLGIVAKRQWVRRLNSNLETMCGIHSVAERELSIIDYCRQQGRYIAEMNVLQQLVKQGRVEVVGKHNLICTSRPTIFVSCHLSNWELGWSHAINLLAETAEETKLCLLHQSSYPHLITTIEKTRKKWFQNLELVAAAPMAMRKIGKAIANGSNILIFVDEHWKDFVWGPSLGRNLPYAGNRWLSARLAVQESAPIIPLHMETLSLGRYRLVIGEKFLPETGDALTETISLADKIDRYFDAAVRAHPEQWHFLSRYEPDSPVPSRGFN